MKGLTSLLLSIILVVLFVAIGLFFSAKAQSMYNKEEQTLGSMFGLLRVYMFNINDFIVAPAEGINSTTYDTLYKTTNSPFCDALKGCIKKSIDEGGTWCMVNASKYAIGTTFYTSDIRAAIDTYCGAEHLYEPVAGSTREVCYFSKPSLVVSPLEEDDTTLNYNLSTYQPYFHGCYLDNSFMGSSNTILHVCDGAESSNCASKKYSFPKGGWAVIYVRADPGTDASRTCQLNMTICGQRAIGAAADNITVTIFNVTRDLSREMGCQKWDSVFNVCRYEGVGVFGSWPHFYLYNVTGKPVDEDTVLSAIDLGMWEWSKMHFYDGTLINTMPTPLKVAKIIHYTYDSWTTVPWDSYTSSRDAVTALNAVDPASPTLYHAKIRGVDFGAAKYIQIFYGIKKVYSKWPDNEGKAKDDVSETKTGPVCGSAFIDHCDTDQVCVDFSGKGKCCPTSYPRYEKNDGTCWTDGITLIPAVLVCTCDKEDCT